MINLKLQRFPNKNFIFLLDDPQYCLFQFINSSLKQDLINSLN